ncbi:molybdopterin/thiamine biosynthesis dinucleotide-utilizing protein [Microbacterium sorbitolivorans]|uniref:ThiF family adenylyltransferase n=1 Tax=Microbacterium sorbitolivorans TaxID=1867410 RepID=UPI0019BAE279|nr:ThiF family adenylyltransferase [Microbacterium sorbitolivorans]GGF39746.1 molybdopterin/thiamine biosynthesis dinucleotide-utilizing protein [Microbacterium sorbitolivorans]
MALPPLVAPAASLSPAEAARTARHAALYPLGELGQRRLAAARVAIVGAGGLGSPAVLALAAAGVGRLTVIDDDVVDASNLQRQILHRMRDEGRAKVDSAVRAAADLAPECVVEAVRERLTPDNAERLLAGADVVLDGTDTFASRLAVAAACENLGVPLVWGAVQEFTAQVTVFWSRPPAGAPRVVLADLHPGAGELPTCAEVGVLGSVVLQVGSLMATQAILLIAGIGDPLLGRIALVDALRSTAREVPLLAAAGDGDPAAGAADPGAGRADPAPAAADLPAGAVVVDVREPSERAGGVIPGAVLIPLAELAADERIRFDAPVVTVCASGVRSRRAAEILAARGTGATSMPGGMAAWTGRVEVPA